ncbi:MAG: DNA helicase UvrD [Elusimicrobia bacterium GWA2_69_24]|nr:MAG: DNA helicase UvrD [Elusimicrobia bacterium GWA2_69_24]HBL17570.1 DNA helicase UvrD [Elusimicrobiota bacterium]
MRFTADLHIHSYLSRACSRSLRPETLQRWAQLKGLTVLGTGDFTHPVWRAELREKLEDAEPGLFRLRKDLTRLSDLEVPDSCRAPVRFLLQAEISCIYRRGGKTRKVHNLVYVPSFKAADALAKRLGKIGNLKADGRPILGLDSQDLFAMVLECSEEAHLVPAHAWTPHFSVFGSQSGFDALEECFGDLAPRIFAIETGLSSDPPMNWRVSALDRLTLLSNSDAHSPEKLGREANLFDAELSYGALFSAVRSGRGKSFLGTLEFFPEEGKYHADGHAPCQTRLQPEETRAANGLCPRCGKPVTVGVLHRVAALADRADGVRPAGSAGFQCLVPLKEILGEARGVGSGSVRVDRDYHALLERFGSELHILRERPLRDVAAAGHPLAAVALGRMRKGEIEVAAGYDGEYGTVSLLREEDRKPSAAQPSFL